MLDHTYQLLYKNGRWDTSGFVSWQWAPADPKRKIKEKTVYLFQTVSKSSLNESKGEGPNGDPFFEIKKEYIFTRKNGNNGKNVYVLPEIFFVHGVPNKGKNQELEESLGINCENLVKKAKEKKELYHHYFDLNTPLTTKMSQTVYVKEGKVHLLRNDAEVKGVTKADLNVAYTNIPYASFASVKTWVKTLW